MNSIAYVLSETSKGQDFYLLMGDFLDEFYYAGEIKRVEMISVIPQLIGDPVHLAYAAAAIHKLCNDYGLSVPKWVFDSKCYLREDPHFGCNAQGDLRLWFMYKSPSEFKHRNLFVDENVLVRI